MLAALARYAPAKRRAALSQQVLAPLRERWMPSDGRDYLTGLGDWVSDAPLSPAELEGFLELLVNFPVTNQAPTSLFVPVYAALAGRSDLSTELKAAFEQFLAGLAAEATARADRRNAADVATAVQLSLVRARLGYPRQAWAGVRDAIEGARPDTWGYEPTFKAIDRLLTLAPPDAAERKWLLAELRRAEQYAQDAQVPSDAKLPLSRLVTDDAERLALVLSGLRSLTVDQNGARDLYKDLLSALDRVSRAPLEDRALAERWKANVSENAARLNRPQ